MTKATFKTSFNSLHLDTRKPTIPWDNM